MYDISVPVFSERLRALGHVLSKAEANAAERKIDPQVFLQARLAPDMLTLTRQVQIATDHAKRASARLAGKEAPPYEDTEASFAELQARIAKAIDYLKSLAPGDIEGSEERPIELKVGQRELKYAGAQYLLNFAMPNFYFHVTTAYASCAIVACRSASRVFSAPTERAGPAGYFSAISRARRGKSAGLTPISARSALLIALSSASAARYFDSSCGRGLEKNSVRKPMSIAPACFPPDLECRRFKRIVQCSICMAAMLGPAFLSRMRPNPAILARPETFSAAAP